MEVAVEVEDDVFFADLSKQINLLIMDDDDEDMVTHSPSVSFKGFSQAQFQQAPQLPIFFHEQISCRTRESKGTGVFIPRSSSNQRRKNRHGIRNNNISSSNAKMFQKQFDNSRGLPASAQHHSYTEPAYNNSFNSRRF